MESIFVPPIGCIAANIFHVNSCSCHSSYYLFQYYGHINHGEYFVNDPSTPDLFDCEAPVHLLLPAIHMVSSRGIPYWMLRQLCGGKICVVESRRWDLELEDLG